MAMLSVIDARLVRQTPKFCDKTKNLRYRGIRGPSIKPADREFGKESRTITYADQSCIRISRVKSGKILNDN